MGIRRDGLWDKNLLFVVQLLDLALSSKIKRFVKNSHMKMGIESFL